MSAKKSAHIDTQPFPSSSSNTSAQLNEDGDHERAQPSDPSDSTTATSSDPLLASPESPHKRRVPTAHLTSALNPTNAHSSYPLTLSINLAAFLLPALYSTLSKLWIARIDSTLIATTESYTYIGVITEVLNEGLPRAAWTVIGDRSSRRWPARLGLAHSLILFQAAAGLLLSLIFLAAAPAFARTFVPAPTRAASLAYVRLGAFSALASSTEAAIAAATRSLGMPDVPLAISSAKFVLNILLDFLVISKFHVGSHTPNINDQAAVRLGCDLGAAGCGVLYFLWATRRTLRLKKHAPPMPSSPSSPPVSSFSPDFEPDTPASRPSRPRPPHESARPHVRALLILARPGLSTLLESLLRNALYLWLVSGIISLSLTHATAWSIFTSIRWGLVMVPVQSLEATTLAFTAHAWGAYRRSIGTLRRRCPRTPLPNLLRIVRPALVSITLALVFEIPLCIFMGLWGARPFAQWLSTDEKVADVAAGMWRSIDWCFVFYGVSTQAAAVLLATKPAWYLAQSAVANVGYVLPWAVVCQLRREGEGEAWTDYAWVFGGSLVVSAGIVAAFDGVWAWRMCRGKLRMDGFRE